MREEIHDEKKKKKIKVKVESWNFSFWGYVQDFQTHSHFDAQNVQNVSRWDYVYFFPKEKTCKKVWRTDGQTDGQSLLEDASRIKNVALIPIRFHINMRH